MPLKSFRFRYDEILEQCVSQTRRIQVLNPAGPWETGRHVRKVQQALLDLGYSVGPRGADSQYGPDTAAAVSAFKTHLNIQPNDGIVGKLTMEALDAKFQDEPPPFPQPIPGIGEMTLDDFLEALQAAEAAYPSDSREEFLTRIRQLYYPGVDPEGLTFREITFDQLLPDAPIRNPDGSRRILTSSGMPQTFFNRLAQRAPENPTPQRPLDNPSPYFLDITGAKVDIGHLLLTMDALLHPRASSIPYQVFEVPAIDPASWVADLAIGVVWALQDGTPGAPKILPPRPGGVPDFEGYYAMSAPDADLIGDIDAFSMAPAMAGSAPLSRVIVAYYLDGELPGGYRVRYRNFLSQLVGSTSPTAEELIAIVSLWKPRVDRFADLFATGSSAAFVEPPPRRQWQFTPDAIANFLQWLLDGARIEADRFD